MREFHADSHELNGKLKEFIQDNKDCIPESEKARSRMLQRHYEQERRGDVLLTGSYKNRLRSLSAKS